VSGTCEASTAAPVEIHEGKVDGRDTVTFCSNADYQGQTYTLVYKRLDHCRAEFSSNWHRGY